MQALLCFGAISRVRSAPALDKLEQFPRSDVPLVVRQLCVPGASLAVALEGAGGMTSYRPLLLASDDLSSLRVGPADRRAFRRVHGGPPSIQAWSR